MYFLEFEIRLDQRGYRQNDIKGGFCLEDHSLYQRTKGSFLYHRFLYKWEPRG